MEVTTAFNSTQERFFSGSMTPSPTSDIPLANGSAPPSPGIVAAIVIISILVLVVMMTVSAVVATVCYSRKRQRKRIILHAVYGNEQGVQLLKTTVPRNSHHAAHMCEGPCAMQEGAQIRTESQTQSSVRTSGGRRHPYTCLESQYEEVVTHYEMGHANNDTVNITAYDGICSPNLVSHGLTASTPSRTRYTIVPPKAVRLTKSEHVPVHLNEIYTGMDVSCVKYEKVPFRPPSIHIDGLYDQLAGRRCIEIPRSVIDVKETIGSGEFGNVYRGLWETPYGPEEVALKILKAGTGEEDKVKFLQEAAIMAQFKHPHIVRLLGAVTVDEPTMLVLEYLEVGNLLMWLQKTRQELSGNQASQVTLPTQLLQFCREIADGMQYLSNKGFVHRDLAARNILLDKGLKCHIGDFGLSHDIISSELHTSSLPRGKVPIRWTAPESLFQGIFSTHSDVWSYGVLLYEIWSLGRRPYSSLQSQAVVQLLKSECSPHIPPPPGCPLGVYKIMVQCWNKDHHQRPSFMELLQQISSLGEDHEQLQVPRDSLKGVQDPKRASRLGSPLVTAEQLYKELQSI